MSRGKPFKKVFREMRVHAHPERVVNKLNKVPDKPQWWRLNKGRSALPPTIKVQLSDED